LEVVRETWPAFGFVSDYVLTAYLLLAFAQNGSISGTVIQTNGDPVRKATVSLTWQGSPRSWATQRTDASGRFVFENLPAGKYDLRATKARLGTAAYGTSNTYELGDVLVLNEGETRNNIKLRFISSSSISGRVTDAEGDPVQSANVALMRPTRDLGQRVLVNVSAANTDDRGEYRITNVQPGRYYLRVLAGPGRRGAGNRLFANQYYGGANDWKDAAPLTVPSGESLSHMDFHLVEITGVGIRGHVTGMPAPHPLDGHPSVQVLLTSMPDSSIQMGSSADGPDYEFQMPLVPSGRYRVAVFANYAGKGYSGSEMIDAAPGMGDVSIPVAPDISLKGQFTIEGKGSLKPSDFRITMNTARTNVSAAVGADGKFTLDQVSVGEWEINITPVPRGGYIKSIRLGDKDVRFTKIPIEPRLDAPLNIVISMNTASVEGQLDTPRAGVVVAPVGAFHDFARFYYGGMTDDEGKFKLTGIAPGKYRVIAIEKMAAANFRSPEAVDQLVDLGEAIDLAEGAVLTVHPKVIPIERAREVVQ
jgi:protocatechuate 3,4-dioxygenase beta subunit